MKIIFIPICATLFMLSLSAQVKLGKLFKKNLEDSLATGVSKVVAGKLANRIADAVGKTIDKSVAKNEKQHSPISESDKKENSVEGKNDLERGKATSVNANQVPAKINFERIVVQHINGEDGKSKNVTYYFTVNGDYAMAKMEYPGDDGPSTVIYTSEGVMVMVNEEEKTITIMNLVRVVGEGADIGKELAEKIKKAPLEKDAPEELKVRRTGNTKTICHFPAIEYEIQSEGGKSNWWYAKVDFDPILIYTMGMGKKVDMNKTKGNKDLINNPFAIPVQNKNYFFAEIEAAGKKGMETVSISSAPYIFSTSGYTIKDMRNRGLKEIIQSKNQVQ